MDIEELKRRCEVSWKANNKPCARCKQEGYCSKQCQSRDRKTLKSTAWLSLFNYFITSLALGLGLSFLNASEMINSLRTSQQSSYSPSNLIG